MCFIPTHVSAQRKGACSEYAYRALLCRAFGFSFSRDKEDMPSFKEIKASQQEAVEKTIFEAQHGKIVPSISNYYVRLTEIDHHLSQHQCPINEAMSKALEMVLNHSHYTEEIVNADKLVS